MEFDWMTVQTYRNSHINNIKRDHRSYVTRLIPWGLITIGDSSTPRNDCRDFVRKNKKRIRIDDNVYMMMGRESFFTTKLHLYELYLVSPIMLGYVEEVAYDKFIKGASCRDLVQCVGQTACKIWEACPELDTEGESINLAMKPILIPSKAGGCVVYISGHLEEKIIGARFMGPKTLIDANEQFLFIKRISTSR